MLIPTTTCKIGTIVITPLLSTYILAIEMEHLEESLMTIRNSEDLNLGLPGAGVGSYL